MAETKTESDQGVQTTSSFATPYIIEPKSEHMHTAIMLHGRGSTAQEFAEDFLASTLSDESTMYEKLSGWRWVFPSSQELWSTAFQEYMPAWFEAHSLTDITTRQDLQVNDIRDSVNHISGIIEQEVERLEGNSQRLVLGGISQGGAIALWTLLCQRNPAMRPGAVVVASTWLPFAANIERALAAHHPMPGEPHETEFDLFVEQMVAVKNRPEMSDVRHDSRRLCPVFVGHGVDDAYVDVALGRQAARILSRAGVAVEWKEYSGAEEEGHWFKVPDEMDDIHEFLARFQGVR